MLKGDSLETVSHNIRRCSLPHILNETIKSSAKQSEKTHIYTIDARGTTRSECAVKWFFKNPI